MGVVPWRQEIRWPTTYKQRFTSPLGHEVMNFKLWLAKEQVKMLPIIPAH